MIEVLLKKDFAWARTDTDVLSFSFGFCAIASTTQVVDTSNTPPEQAVALVDLRIVSQSSLNATITERDARPRLEL